MKRLSAIICTLLLIAAASAPVWAKSDAGVIYDTKTLLSEISKAEAGATLLVGDMDFTPDGGVTNEFARVLLQKSINLKGGYKDRNAVFKGASFNIVGSKLSGELLECSFSGIDFDGGVNAQSLSDSDWQLCYGPEEMPVSNDPLKAQYAVYFKGNVSASFENCTFKNYMYEYGPAMRAYYGDYTASPVLLEMFGDYSSCALQLRIKNCVFSGNAAEYGGGAIYLEGNNNIIMYADDCSFAGNLSGCSDFSEGGGACCLRNAEAEFTDCSFVSNEGNHSYGSEPDIDRSQGGAVLSTGGRLQMVSCKLNDNRASYGGGVRLQNSRATFNDCEFKENKAVPSALNPDEESGPWSGMGMGGGLYINTDPSSPVYIYNSEFSGNEAEFGYGALYAYYNDNYKDVMPLGLGSADLYYCSIHGNKCLTDYDYSETIFPWASHPGDIVNIEYLKLHACSFVDDCYAEDFQRYETPSEDNDYNYIASPERAAADSASLKKISVPGAVSRDWDKNLPVTQKDLEKAERSMKGRRLGGIIILVMICLAGFAAYKQTKRPAAEAETPEKKDLPAAAGVFTREDVSALGNDIRLRQQLTDRELEVMCEYISGSSRAELAEKLSISEATAKTHISNIYSKLNVKNKAELVQKLKKEYLQ